VWTSPRHRCLCWSEQRQSCELERGSSSIAGDPCLVTEGTHIVTAQGRLRPGPHTLSFFYSFFFFSNYESTCVEYTSGCYVLDHQPGGMLQGEGEGNVPTGLVAAAAKCSKLRPWARNTQQAWFPHEPTQAYIELGKWLEGDALINRDPGLSFSARSTSRW
jgi:hypothetical protein